MRQSVPQHRRAPHAPAVVIPARTSCRGRAAPTRNLSGVYVLFSACSVAGGSTMDCTSAALEIRQAARALGLHATVEWRTAIVYVRE
jgi:hypothetical protein